MQKLGIIFDTCAAISDRERVLFMQKHGFEATFLMSNDPAIEERVALLKASGITIDNCHAPFDGINCMWYPTTAGDEMLSRLVSGVENCARYEIPVIIVHVSSGENPPRVSEVGLARFVTVEKHLKERFPSLAIVGSGMSYYRCGYKARNLHGFLIETFACT